MDQWGVVREDIIPFDNSSIPLHVALSPDLTLGREGIFPVVAAWLSLMGCIFIIVMYARMRPSFSIFSLVFNLAIANAISSTSEISVYILTMVLEHETAIKLEGFFVGLSNCTLLVCWSWSAFIALYHLAPNRIKLLRLNILAWAFSLLTFLPAGCYGLYRNHLIKLDSLVCSNVASDVMLLSLGSICYVFSFGAYIYLLCRRRNKIPVRVSRLLDTTQPVGREERENSNRLKKKKVLGYNLIFVICYSARLITFVGYHVGEFSFVVRVLFLSISNLFGLANAIVYGSSVEVRRHLQFWCCKKRMLADYESMQSLVPDDPNRAHE
eukprot:TRINITY_DN4734_c0_g1_i1.p1 TRINITY_DN4734_c0_g1~~TRINITY_DN4734_c0_g1_i1.p1  ORF type:complete len:325 (-),score=26.76 TRINITY_DN4734_c0_g1_i1:21-995(-)